MVLREELNTECGTCGCVRHRGVPRRTLGIPGLADTRCVRPARGCPPTLNTLVLNLSKDSGYSSDESCEFTVASVIAPHLYVHPSDNRHPDRWSPRIRA